MDGKIIREIYLIRHGESLSNIGIGIDTPEGNFDPVLSPKGERQGESVGKYLGEKGLDVVYSSGLKRAVQTAAKIVEHQEKAGEVLILPKLSEICMDTTMKGCTIDELRKLAPNVPVNPAPEMKEGEDLVYIHTEKEESEEVFLARAKEVLEYIENKYNNGEKIGIVCHARFMNYLILSAMGYEKGHPAYEFSLYNTSITKIRYHESGKNKYGDIMIRYINRVNHLEKYPVE